MVAKFNADKVFEMGMQIERNGREFYRRAAAGAQDAAVRRMLSSLAEMEDDHEGLFGRLKAALPKEAAPELLFDPDGTAARYLRAAADTHVFNAESARPDDLSDCPTAEDVLRKAMEFEKDSVVFFLALKEVVPEDLGKAEVDGLIREELDHIALLSRELGRLAAE